MAQIEELVERYRVQWPEDNSDDEALTSLNFQLSDCSYLAPSQVIESGDSGVMSIRTLRRFEVKYPNLGKVLFDRHYQSYARSDISGRVETSNLVAEVGELGGGSLKNVGAIEAQMDDVCLLASLAARHRVVVLGYQYETTREFYRCWKFPLKRYRPTPQGHFGEGLIQKFDFGGYFAVISEKFLEMNERDKQRVREAIYTIAPAFSLGSVETEFLAVFSAIESLATVEQSGTSSVRTIVDEQRWKVVKREVRKAVTSLGDDFSENEKDSIRQKIGELNRPSLKSAFADFFQRYSIEMDDLWPIFGSREMPGLAEIRNQLAHGDNPAARSPGALGVAKSHLVLLLERSLLSVLGCSVDRSRANKSNTQVDIPTQRSLIEGLQRALSKEPVSNLSWDSLSSSLSQFTDDFMADRGQLTKNDDREGSYVMTQRNLLTSSR